MPLKPARRINLATRLRAHSVASIDELGMDAGSTVGASREAVDLADAIEQRLIALGAG